MYQHLKRYKSDRDRVTDFEIVENYHRNSATRGACSRSLGQIFKLQ